MTTQLFRRSALLLCGTAGLLLTGCMGYRLGGTQPEGVRSVHLAPVVNRTGEPALELEVAHALRSRIAFDGRLTLQNSPEEADADIMVTLTGYELRPVAFRDDLKTTPDQYRLCLTATAVMKDAASGREIASSTTYGEARFPFQSDLTTSKRIALPQAAQELARFMVDDLIEQW